MYITKLHLQNFKSYINQDFEFKKITLLTGLNGAGKSTVFQALRMFWSYEKNSEAILNSYGEIDTLKNINSKEKFLEISIDIENSNYLNLKFDLSDLSDIKSLSSQEEKDTSLLNIAYISASRLGPTEYQPIRNSTIENLNVGRNGEYTLDILSKYRDMNLPEIFGEDIGAKKNILITHVERWLKVISPNIKLETELNKKMNVASFTSNGFTPLNIGFGVSYTLSIIVQLLYSVILFENNGIKTVLLMENPEAHLHPKGQTKIAEFIASLTNYGVQVIMETHSDYILDGLRLAVKDGEIEHEDTKLYYLELDEEDNTKVKSPQIDKDGYLDEWPENFFDTSLNNSMRLM